MVKRTGASFLFDLDVTQVRSAYANVVAGDTISEQDFLLERCERIGEATSVVLTTRMGELGRCA